MELFVIENGKNSKLYELAFGRFDTYYHFISLDDDEIDRHQFESRKAAIQGLEEAKECGIITNYYQFQ